MRVFYSSMSDGSPSEKYSEGFSLAWGRRHGVDAGGDGVVGEHLQVGGLLCHLDHSSGGEPSLQPEGHLRLELTGAG